MSNTVYNREKTMSAWRHFVETGEIPADSVREEVANSWQRCRDAGVDPFGIAYPRMSRKTLLQKQDQYRDILSYAIPCMHLLHAIMVKGNVSLTSPDLFTYYMLSSYEVDPLSYGIYLTERNCGNTAISLAKHAEKPFYLHKYEKFRVVDQNYSSAAAPFFKGGELAGLISAGATSGSPPQETLDLVRKTTEILTTLLEEKPSKKRTLELISGLISMGHKPIILLDKNGAIVSANKDSRRFIDISEDESSPSNLADFLANKDDMSIFVSDDEEDQRRYCNIKTIYGNVFNCIIRKKGNMGFPDGSVYTVIVFEISLPGKQVRERAPSALPSLPSKLDNVEYIGNSLAWQKVDKVVKKIARFPSSVLIQGESGTGKEVVAHTIHNLSGRAGNFVAVNCGDIPESLLQSELFGYEKGAFTGANREGSIGKFEYADRGTVFLDEIGDMPLSMQVSLLRFIQERTILKVGSNKSKVVDVRIIAATNKNIEQMVKDKLFRNDLYYRLNIIGLTLPPLRERKGDIPGLAQHFIRDLSGQYGIPTPEIEPDVYDILKRHDWPGNVRELRNVMEKVLIMSENERITASTIYAYVFDYDDFNSSGSSSATRMTEKEELLQLMELNKGNITRTAAALGVTRDTLYRRIKKYGIDAKKFNNYGN